MDEPRLVAGVGETGDGKRDIGAATGRARLRPWRSPPPSKPRLPRSIRSGGHAEHLGLGLLAVGDEAAVEGVGDALDVGQQARRACRRCSFRRWRGRGRARTPWRAAAGSPPRPRSGSTGERVSVSFKRLSLPGLAGGNRPLAPIVPQPQSGGINGQSRHAPGRTSAARRRPSQGRGSVRAVREGERRRRPRRRSSGRSAPSSRSTRRSRRRSIIRRSAARSRRTRSTRPMSSMTAPSC